MSVPVVSYLTQEQLLQLFYENIDKFILHKKTTTVTAVDITTDDWFTTSTKNNTGNLEIETKRYAHKGDVRVTNNATGESWTMPKDTFLERNVLLHDNIYQAKGEGLFLEITQEMMDTIFSSNYIIASWGEKMLVKTGDFLVVPCPKQNEVYRIERSVKEVTYSPV